MGIDSDRIMDKQLAEKHLKRFPSPEPGSLADTIKSVAYEAAHQGKEDVVRLLLEACSAAGESKPPKRKLGRPDPSRGVKPPKKAPEPEQKPEQTSDQRHPQAPR